MKRKILVFVLVITIAVCQPMIISCAEEAEGDMECIQNEQVDNEKKEDENKEEQNDEQDGSENALLNDEQESEKLPLLNGKWIQNNIGWRYRYENGTWPAGEIVDINGIKYAFDSEGYMVTGWFLSTEGWYYFNKNGAMAEGWIYTGKRWYYLEGENTEYPGLMVANCKKSIHGSVYFFDGNGAMLTGWIKRAEGWYYANGSGAIQKGWVNLRGIWYYLDGNNVDNTGLMVENCKKEINGISYFFSASGAMLTGWIKRAEGWYYANGSGAIQKGWVNLKGIWYYLDEYDFESPGLMISNGWKVVNGQRYYFHRSGAMATNWLYLDDNWFYFGIDGSMKVGWQRINGIWYYFYQDSESCGRMAKNTEIEGWRISDSGAAYPANVEQRIQDIMKYTYVPYRYGGGSPSGWDCSGFTKWALEYLGVSIPRTSVIQAAGGQYVDKSNMALWKPGDILVYSQGGRVNHVALYLGGGMLMHALSTRHNTLIQSVEYYEKWDSKNTLTGVRRYLN